IYPPIIHRQNPESVEWVQVRLVRRDYRSQRRIYEENVAEYCVGFATRGTSVCTRQGSRSCRELRKSNEGNSQRSRQHSAERSGQSRLRRRSAFGLEVCLRLRR